MEGIKLLILITLSLQLTQTLFENVTYCSPAPHKEKNALSKPCYNHSIHICQWLPEEYTGQQNTHLNVATVSSGGLFLSAEPIKHVLQL